MNKWMQVSLCGMIILAASGCSGKEASPAAISPAAASATPSPVATTTAATPTPQVSATVTPLATAAPAATASPVAAASATPQPQASATPSAKPTPVPTPAPASATPAPTAAPTPAPSVKPQETTVSSSSAKAELLYKDNCLVCHGVGLAGDYGPNLTKVGSRRTKEQIVTQIMNGKVEMPPFKDKLKPDDIETLANWLSSMK
ncbi:cytochrome c [Paenibacillus sp. LjRoot153]|uniref:c-type cytochrome n=1 Tax=Paenibacillus sp. LjRoot153 TaxID=3342270 RepID=UPI003ECC9082